MNWPNYCLFRIIILYVQCLALYSFVEQIGHVYLSPGSISLPNLHQILA